ncbi:MAG: hypothetical protein GF311_18905 [Candidatus Lokiarchaeota archaeon]|nr:hypothetical protein [Candidatus Lokiarchaeota archaeon]
MNTHTIDDLQILNPIPIEKIRKDKIAWIWVSKRHHNLFFSWENKELGIYNYQKDLWQVLDLREFLRESICVEALTTTENYLCLAGFGADFVLYRLPDLTFKSQIPFENSGYGASSFKDTVFINGEIGILQIDLDKEVKVGEFNISTIFKDNNFLLDSVSTNNKVITGRFTYTGSSKDHNAKKIPELSYITWNLSNFKLVSIIPTIFDDYTDPYLTDGGYLIDNDQIWDIKNAERIHTIFHSEYGYIIYLHEGNMLVSDELQPSQLFLYHFNSRDAKQRIIIKDSRIHNFKNWGDFLLIEKNKRYYLVDKKEFLVL